MAASFAAAFAADLIVCAADLHVGIGQQYTTIQSAIDAAASGDTILVHPGTYSVASPALSVGFISGKQLVLRSTDGPTVTKLVGVGDANASRGLYFDASGSSSAPSVVSGFQFLNLRAPLQKGSVIISGLQTSGSGIAVIGSHARVENCLFQACQSPNTASIGGAVAVAASSTDTASLHVDGCAFLGCIAQNGGAIGGANDGTVPVEVVIDHTTVSNCIASAGGGIYFRDSVHAVAQNIDLTTSVATFNGGAAALVASAWGTPTLSIGIGSTLHSNSAFVGRGGAIHLQDGASIDLLGVLIKANRAGFGGSAISATSQNQLTTATLFDCELTNNQQTGGAIPSGHGSLVMADGVCEFDFQSCTLDGNTGLGPILDGWAPVLSLDACKLEQNRNDAAAFGQALCIVQPGADVALTNCVFRNNDPGVGADPILMRLEADATADISGSFFCGLDAGTDMEGAFGDLSGYTVSPGTVVVVGCPPCSADVAGPGPDGSFVLMPDGRIDGKDLLAVLSFWGAAADPKNPGAVPIINQASATVGSDDLLLVLADWGADCNDP